MPEKIPRLPQHPPGTGQSRGHPGGNDPADAQAEPHRQARPGDPDPGHSGCTGPGHWRQGALTLALALHDAEAVGNKGQVGQAGIPRRVEAGHVEVRVGRREIDGHAHQITGH